MPAWPYDADLEAIVAGQTTAKKTFGDGIMLAIRRVFSGTYRVLKLEVGAAGASTVAANGEIYASGNISTPANVSATGTVTGNTKVASGGNVEALSGYVKGKRLSAPGGTALVAGDIAPGANWGDTAAVSIVSADDSGGTFRVTCGGAGIAPNPSLIISFKDGTWTTAPFAMAVLEGCSVVTDFGAVGVGSLATTLTLQYKGTPVNTRFYDFRFVCIGR